VLGELIDEAVNEGADLGLAVLRHGGSERGGQPGWEADRSIGKSGGDSQARSLSPHYHAVVPGCP
jgi:hypothetical protein